MKPICLFVATLALAGCDRGGWDPNMECKQRDLASGLCTEAVYSCNFERSVLAYWPDGPRCYVRSEVRR